MAKDKQLIRKELLANRASLSQEEITLRSQRIVEQLWQIIATNDFEVVHTFLPIGNEVNTWLLVEQALTNGVKVVIPKTLGKLKLKHLLLEDTQGMVEGKFGTLYPEKEMEYTGAYDLIVVPGLAFDQYHHRIGYGAGYYDVFLKEHPGSLKVGVGFDFQLVDALPVEAHDVPLDKIILG
ncbi:5-formyltetrahydrofolate cyclo-ligase [Rapidithrix thailandica]|uniref:5-formyltetrahydrofolate cyclo-ligase n=1 Tax=Rapidithrix thailandica TaxID=413964 RepID=A0AAW9S5P1_9BACT